MTEQRKSFQKAEYVSHELTTRGKEQYLLLTYKRLDGDTAGKEFTTGTFISKLDAESKTQIKKGGEFVIVKIEEEVKGKKYWNLLKVEDISTYKPKPAYKPFSGQGTSGFKSTLIGRGSSYDNLGQQIGNSMTNAVNSLGAGKTVQEYEDRAYELVKAGDRVRARVEEKITAALPTNDTTTTETDTGSIDLSDIDL